MNKKVITLCAAALLFGGAGVNSSFALSKPTAVVYANNKANTVEIADGVKFLLSSSDNKYYQVLSVKTKDSKEVVTVNTNKTTDVTKASVFEIRNAQKNGAGFIFELFVDGKPFVSTTDGKVATKDDEFSKLNNKFYIASSTTDFNQVLTATIPYSKTVISGFDAATISFTYLADDLKDFNQDGTTFSFDFADDELVGNLFKNLTPVSNGNNTYFISGEKSDKFVLNKPETYKGISILAIDHKNRYGLNNSNDGEGYSLRMVDAEKFLKKAEGVSAFKQADSLSLAYFTSIAELDQLNNAKEIVLKMKPNANLLKNVTSSQEFQIAAVKASVSDSKAYVTTVASQSNWAAYKNALLGDNTYFDASEFLRDKMRTVAILNVKGNAENNKNYYKYLVESTLDATANNVVYKPASEIDFEMPQNQWVVSNFDGKYTLTLKNRLTNQQIVLSNITKTENGYNAQLKGANSNELDGSISFKLLDLATSKTDGYKVLSDDEIKNGITLSFSGETQVAGEKEFFTSTNKAVNAFVPVMDASKAVAINAVEAQKAVESYLSYAYLNAEGKMTTATDTLMVPTYTLKVGENAIANSFAKDNKVVAFAKNMVGNYSVALVKNASTPLAISSVEVAGIKYNKKTNQNPDGLAYTTANRYEVKEVTGTFATVNVTTFSKLNTSLPAVPGHYTFDNARGSINVKDLVGINEGFLASEGQVFWLDTADVEKATPSFYISFGKDSVAARNYMFNPIDSAKVFDEFTASYKYNKEYYYGEDAKEGNGTLKVAFASTVAEKGKDLADAFKFNITLNDVAVADEYVLTSVKDNTLKVAQKNGVVILVKENNVDGIEPMVFTVNPAEAPTSNESVVASEVKVVANNGSVVVKNAAGKNVVVSTILGQVVANEVLTSDNATINVPAGIVVVAVDGESFKVSVK